MTNAVSAALTFPPQLRWTQIPLAVWPEGEGQGIEGVLCCSEKDAGMKTAAVEKGIVCQPGMRRKPVQFLKLWLAFEFSSWSLSAYSCELFQQDERIWMGQLGSGIGMLAPRKSQKEETQCVNITDVGWPWSPILIRKLMQPEWLRWSGTVGKVKELPMMRMKDRTYQNKR